MKEDNEPRSLTDARVAQSQWPHAHQKKATNEGEKVYAVGCVRLHAAQFGDYVLRHGGGATEHALRRQQAARGEHNKAARSYQAHNKT